ncbi:hypothetical protein [uncultured Draconibacterium sp.]|uniref:hypothetical protein n=1 Tax=uncultured Draconibacterium sp. TaxID=1573823 RepID=UPI0025EA11E0|nr:hypothetical protein [uncultured Draconibacterium sp.]
MKEIYLGKNKLKPLESEVQGGFVEIENEKFYKISNYNGMPDFFMTIVSDSNHWMYLSSNGALTAGRKNRDNSLFPYYTDDKIHDYKGKTGSKTICLVQKNEKTFLWEPFTDEAEKLYQVERNLYKSIYGNKIIFEERNTDLEINFRYGWYNSEKFGWIKKSTIQNTGNDEVKIEVLDGIRNLLPYGVDYAFQNEYSNLLDAYKKNALLSESKLGLFMLSSIPVDRAEPSEALKATSVWSVVPADNARYLVSDKQLEAFRNGQKIETELDVRASRGAYYTNMVFKLSKAEKKQWYMAAEVNQDAGDIANLDNFILTNSNIAKTIEEDITAGTQNLIKIVANADGLQLGNEELGFARHFSNTLFNVMRGGIFANNYTFSTNDFKLYVKQTNTRIAKKFEVQLAALPTQIKHGNLLTWAKDTGSPELERICFEYLPLTFSRRHGDPSRPWNQFSIETKNEDGTDKLNYQGNWRDIFQNWEALCLSYPEYIEGIIAKFVNASTADGYNPYRITREGMDWECPDPDDPWAYIGYWGDHQIIYLQKFLEQTEAYHPGKLDELLAKEIFVYANVPYRIKSFEELVVNPKDTIVFDFELNDKIEKLAAEVGADGKLIFGNDGEIYKVNLMEKILSTLLSKLSNFIPEAGIWLNTQRPEWNDANNALVGNGVSMVTLYYIRRFLEFWQNKFSKMTAGSFEISGELSVLFDKIFSLFEANTELIGTGFSDEDRYHFTKVLGKAGEEYRQSVYSNSFSGDKQRISSGNLSEFINLALEYVNQSIQKNRREDGLYHAYNLVSFSENSIAVRYLYEMLEGQVAVLSSGALSTTESLEVLDGLKASKLFREDQYSYILYPDRQLPRFVEKNQIPGEAVKKSKLLQKLVAEKEVSFITKDITGGHHFNGTFRNANELSTALAKLDTEKYGDLIQQEKQQVLDIYEQMFDHQSFTGRSGTFYGYEGLGSIYWHMVSKLLLAVQECYFKGVEENADADILGRIKGHYYEIKAGIGLYKSPALYGAFPTDAYSHTPGGAGAKQPGLTGQVKEDVISRFGELGVHISDGKITFNTTLLNFDELLTAKDKFRFIGLDGKPQTIALEDNQLAFTICQVPVIYKTGTKQAIVIYYANGTSKHIEGKSMDATNAALLFKRSGDIEQIDYILTY